MAKERLYIESDDIDSFKVEMSRLILVRNSLKNFRADLEQNYPEVFYAGGVLNGLIDDLEPSITLLKNLVRAKETNLKVVK